MDIIIIMSSCPEKLMSWKTLFYEKFCSWYLASLVAGNLISRLSSSPNPGLNLTDAKQRLCHSLLNSTGEIRHYQLRGTSHFPHAISTAWASLPLTMVYKRLARVSPATQELPAYQLSQQAFNGFVKPNNLTHFSSEGSIMQNAKLGSEIREAHLYESGSLCHPRQIILLLPIPRISNLN